MDKYMLVSEEQRELLLRMADRLDSTKVLFVLEREGLAASIRNLVERSPLKTEDEMHTMSYYNEEEVIS